MSDEAAVDKGTVLLAAYVGFVAGMLVTILLDSSRRSKEKEKIRRHLERALDEVDE